MCTYGQLKKNTKQFCATPPPPRESMALLMSQNCTGQAQKISQKVLKVEA